MAFPYLSEATFDLGTLAGTHFDVETDTENRLDFPHYSQLLIPNQTMPFRGAYCMRVTLLNDGSPADAYVQETGSWDLAATNSIFFRVVFWVSPDITMANTDEFAILQLWSGASTVEGGAYINYTTANGLRLGIGETSASSFKPLTTGVWHQLELKFVIDAGGGNDGTIDAWLDGASFTQVTGLDQGAITSGVLGVLSQDAGTTTGTILFDSIVADDTRVYPISQRFAETRLITSSEQLFVGSGVIERISLLSGAATDNRLQVFDTDVGVAVNATTGEPTGDATNLVEDLKNTANSQVVDREMPLKVARGAYIALSGTNPRALAKIKFCSSYSVAGMRNQALDRRPHPLGA